MDAYDIMFTRRVTLKLVHEGKSKRDGPDVYKFFNSSDLREVLRGRGWTLVRETRSYVFLKAPGSDTGEDVFRIRADVPTREQITKTGCDLHRIGVLKSLRIGEWPACYIPKRRLTMTWQPLKSDGRGGNVLKPDEIPIPPQFEVGASPLWSASIKWDESKNPSFSEQSDNIIQDDDTALQGLLFADPPVGGTSPFNKLDRTSKAHDAELGKLCEGQGLEGAMKRVFSNRYERSLEARRACIAYHGPGCVICGFDFGGRYGDTVNGFIHVHHLTPISQAGSEHQVDPKDDLIPVCPNCHCVIHLREPPYAPDEVRGMLRNEDRQSGLRFVARR